METQHSGLSRRSMLSGTGAAGSAFLLLRPELVRGAGKEKLKAGLIGCGGRGRQAVIDFLRGSENTEVVGLADVFEDKLEGNLRWMKETEGHAAVIDRIRVDPEHRFVGFDAYKKLLATDIDIVMLCTPPGYRPMHFEAAVEANKHVFCEKPFGTDPVGVKRFMAAARKSEQKKLTVMSGAQRRYEQDYVETVKQIQDGKLGDIVATYAYWMGTPVVQQKARDEKWQDMTWQHRAWYSFVWIGGDQIVEQHLHNLDAVNWAMGMHPVKVTATGGAAWRPREEIYGNIFDHIAADFEYPNGVRLSSYCRQIPKSEGVAMNISELVVGTKGRSNLHDRGKKGVSGYVEEHTQMVRSIRGDGPYINHGMAVAESTMTCIMARESAYSGQALTWDQMMNSQLDLQPKEFGYDVKMDVPPLPVPGIYKFS